MRENLKLFTAARIGRALGVSAQAIRKALLDSPESGTLIVRDCEASAWSFDALPESLRLRLLEKAKLGGYLDGERMLAGPCEPWQPPMPLDKIQPEEVAYAARLREALRPALARMQDLALSGSDAESKGVDDYARVFGNRITARYWRELFGRVTQRDRGAEDWERLEIYLPTKVHPKEEVAAVSAAIESVFGDLFGDLAGYISACQRPPTEIEERGIWRRALDEYERLTATGTPGKKAGRKIRQFLFSNAPFLAASRDALLKAFQRKLALWIQKGEAALEDGRKENGGDDFEFPQQDLDLIEAKIVFHYGDYAPAWREALSKGELSEATRLRYRNTPARKSHVPQKLVATLGKRPIWLYTLHRRRNDFNSLKAHFDTVYDGLHSLDCISADDVTLPVWFWYQPSPEAPIVITRGQCLVFIDVPSKRILGWSLQPDKTYNALVIYTQTTRVFADKGVPRALLFEHGIWETSRIIKGSAPFSMTEVTEGLGRLGIQFFHADSPQGKWEVEQVMGLIQNLMEGEPGYCGRDERRDRPDWIKKQLAELQSSTSAVHPSKYFYSFEQWNVRLKKIFEEYNSLAQGGRLMRNRSPDQAYTENWNSEDPPIKLGPELRYLLSHAQYEKVIEPSGFVIQSGNRKFKYFGPELASLVGFKVLVWFNPECPEVAVITDMKRKNPIAVPLHDGVPRLERLTNPKGAVLAEACERREGQVKDIVARYNTLKDKFEMPYRRNLIDAHAEEAITLGQRMEVKKASVTTSQADRKARISSTRAKADRLNIPQALVSDDDDTREALEFIARSKRRQSTEEKETTT